MKKYLLLLLLPCIMLASCTEQDEDTTPSRKEFSLLQSYIRCDFQGEYWDMEQSDLGTCYAVIKQNDSTYGTDIVMASEDINSPYSTFIRKYLLIHLDGSILFSKAAAIKVVFYKNRNISEAGHLVYDAYYTNVENTEVDVHFEQDGSLSGSYKGVLLNSVDTDDRRETTIEFNRIPINLIQ